MAVVANVRRWLFFVQLLFILLGNVFGYSDSCVKKGPCRCEYDSGMTIDLSKAISNTDIYTTSFVTNFNKSDGAGFIVSYFYFHPCENKNFSFTEKVPNECTKTSLCSRDVQFKQNGSNSYYQENVLSDKYKSLGSVENEDFVGSGSTLSLIYDNKPSLAAVVLVCSPDSSALVLTDSDPLRTTLTFFSPSACAFDGSSHHSAGTTLLIVFLVVALVYFVVGALVKHFLMGAQGVEVIPNLTFWKDLPNLVRDGIEFIRNGFKPPPQTSSSAPQPQNPNSYDSI